MDPNVILQTFVEENRALREQFASLIQRLVPASSRGEGPLLKPNKPPHFSGLLTPNSLEVEDWLTVCDNYFTSCGNARDEQKVAFAGLLLTEAALSWWLPLHAQHPNLSWDHFKQAITARFQDHNRSAKARRLLESCTQGRRNIRDYESEFLRIASKIDDMSEADKVYWFLRGLGSPKIRAEVENYGLKSLQEVMSAADRASEIFTDNTNSHSSNSSDYRVMDLDALDVAALRIPSRGHRPNRTPTRNQRWSDEEFQALRAGKGCFNCGKIRAGHRSRDCPERGQQLNSNGQ